jgi:hypothetical protein
LNPLLLGPPNANPLKNPDGNKKRNNKEKKRQEIREMRQGTHAYMNFKRIKTKRWNEKRERRGRPGMNGRESVEREKRI